MKYWINLHLSILAISIFALRTRAQSPPVIRIGGSNPDTAAAIQAPPSAPEKTPFDSPTPTPTARIFRSPVARSPAAPQRTFTNTSYNNFIKPSIGNNMHSILPTQTSVLADPNITPPLINIPPSGLNNNSSKTSTNGTVYLPDPPVSNQKTIPENINGESSPWYIAATAILGLVTVISFSSFIWILTGSSSGNTKSPSGGGGGSVRSIIGKWGLGKKITGMKSRRNTVNLEDVNDVISPEDGMSDIMGLYQNQNYHILNHGGTTNDQRSKRNVNNLRINTNNDENTIARTSDSVWYS